MSESTVIEENHEFTPSDIGVTFVADGKEYPVTFYWFPYYDTPGETIGATSDTFGLEDSRVYRLIGDRFDAIMNGKKYHYRFTTDQVWTEERMLSIYDRRASILHLNSRAQLDGADRGYNRGGFLVFENYSLERILNESSLIFLATYEGERRDISYDNSANGYCDWDRFHIDEVLKGETEKEWYECRSQSKGKVFTALNKVYIAYPVVYAPDFEEQIQYLICLGPGEYGGEYFGQYGTAILDGDILFPRFNTEDHPFYNIKLEEIRDRLADQN